jgi:hypothetical protein
MPVSISVPRLAISAVVGLALALAALSNVSAATGTGTLTAGTLSLTGPSGVSWAATLTGSDLSLRSATQSVVTDATGSGAGCEFTGDMTQFTAGTKTLASNDVNLNGSAVSETNIAAPTASCGAGSTCTLPPSTTAPVTFPVLLPTGTTPAALYTANANTGMGVSDLATEWWLAVAGESNAGTYTSTFTLVAVSGPRPIPQR